MFANHCGAGKWRTGAVTDSSGAIIQHVLGSTIVTRDVAHDTQLILTSQGAGAAAYTGESWLGSGQSGRAVKGSAANHAGDYVCTEGSFSGTRCDIRVMDTGSTINVIGYGQMRDMVTADNIHGEDAAGNGDSGGPVVSVTTGGVLARGTISAMNNDQFVECVGVPGVADDEDGRHCSSEIFYPDIQYQLSGVGVHLNTL